MENIVLEMSIENCIFPFYFVLFLPFFFGFFLLLPKCSVIWCSEFCFSSRLSALTFSLNWSLNWAYVNNVRIDEHTHTYARARAHTEWERLYHRLWFQISIGPCNRCGSDLKYIHRYFVHNHNASNAVINFALIKISAHTHTHANRARKREKQRGRGVMHSSKYFINFVMRFGAHRTLYTLEI